MHAAVWLRERGRRVAVIDADAQASTARLIYKVRFNPKRNGLPHTFIVLNRVQPRTRLARVAAAAIVRYGFPVANNALLQRQAYAEACGEGTVTWRMGGAGVPPATRSGRCSTKFSPRPRCRWVNRGEDIAVADKLCFGLPLYRSVDPV